jgi:hypothetical protein
VKCGGGSCAGRDLVKGWSAFALWCIPTLVVIVGAFLPSVRALLWIASFTIMGTACVVNARGCGRLHCYITGPLFLLGALASLLDATGVVAIGPTLLLAGVGLGTVFAYSLEWARGKYVTLSPP